MTEALAARPDAAAIEAALVGGDLSKLTPSARISYYNQLCQSLDLNPLTKPFEYLTLNGKLTLYARKDCTDQLRNKRSISVKIVAREVMEDVFVVTAQASMPTGRCDESIGAVPIAALKGEARANAMMKAETKAKRRVTLSICGLGMLDESEVESINRTGYSVESPSVPVLRDTHGSGGGDEEHRARAVAPQSDVPDVPAGVSDGGGPLRIMRVDYKPTKNPNVKKSIVVLSDGREVSTIKGQLASLAEQCCQEGDAVTVETENTKWGENLIGLHRVERVIQVEHVDHTEPLDADSIPF